MITFELLSVSLDELFDGTDVAVTPPPTFSTFNFFTDDFFTLLLLFTLLFTSDLLLFFFEQYPRLLSPLESVVAEFRPFEWRKGLNDFELMTVLDEDEENRGDAPLFKLLD